MLELIERLEAASVGSRELDWDSCDALGVTGDEEKLWFVNPVTTSIDAALALAERVVTPARLLDIEGSWEPNDKGVWPAWSVRWYPDGAARDGRSWRACVGSASTPALALVIATLKAVSAKGGEHG